MPDLRGRSPIHEGQGSGLSNITLGQVSGSETKVLSIDELPSHTHSGTIKVANVVADDDIPSAIVSMKEIRNFCRKCS